MSELGRRLRRARVALDLSQAELARRAGCHEHTVGNLENGRRATGLSTLYRLAQAVGAELADLMPRRVVA